MDPNTTLQWLLDAVAGREEMSARERAHDVRDYAERLAEWIEKGGFLPRDPREGGAS